jgi:queuine/archaeosine tRNA-ribosyltransferase
MILPRKFENGGSLKRGTIMIVHNLRNRMFLPEYGLHDTPLMVSIVDITARPNLRKVIAAIGIKAHLGVSGPVVIDSGGYSFMTEKWSNVTADDVVNVYRYLNADIYAALDLPPAPHDDRETRLRKWRKTLRNLDQMLIGLREQCLMPIIHGHTLDEVQKACRDIRQRVARPSIVALGGMVPFMRGLMQRQFSYERRNGMRADGATFVADAISVCRAEFAGSHLHVFGAGSTTTAVALLVLGADSVDSLAWRRAAGFGTIFLAGHAERIISRRDRLLNSRPRIARKNYNLLDGCCCPVCIPYDQARERSRALGNSYIARAVHNVWTLRMEEIAFRDAIVAGTVAEFAASRITGRHRFAKVIREVRNSCHPAAPRL